MSATSIVLLCALVAVAGGLVAVFAGLSSRGRRQAVVPDDAGPEVECSRIRASGDDRDDGGAGGQ